MMQFKHQVRCFHFSIVIIIAESVSLIRDVIISLSLRPVSSMLTFPLRYNFPPLSMCITSWIAKKKSAYAEKVVREKVEFQATLINL